MSSAAHRFVHDDWPLFGLQVHKGDVVLRTTLEEDLPQLASLQPIDYEHDPRAEAFDGEDLRHHRVRLTYQDYWRSVGTWSPQSWSLSFVVEMEGAIVGVQSLEAERFLTLRTVDSGSWLVPSARGRGVGVSMRAAVLALAFDHLDAQAAITSARHDNAASLGVSRHLGYLDNGISLNDSGRGLTELQHMRLTSAAWRASGRGSDVRVVGLEPCLPWFGLALDHQPS